MFNLSHRQLVTIRALGRMERINRVADALGLTGPAVTLQLKQAEAEIGAALFDRTRSGLVPTELGQLAIATAEEVLARLEVFEEQANSLVSGAAGRVRLGAVSTAKYFVPSIIAGFMRLNPGIDVELLVGNRAETIDRIRHHEMDLVIMGRPPRGVSVEAGLIGDHPLVVIAPPDHPLAGQRGISKERLAQEHFLLRETGSGTRMSLDLYFADLLDRRTGTDVEMGSNESIKQAVMAGLGVALVSAHTVAAEVRQNWLVVLDAVDLPIMRQWFCVVPYRRSQSPATQALRDFLIEQGETFLPEV